jgi:hypothetical protein
MTDPLDTLSALEAAATKGPWGTWRETQGYPDDAQWYVTSPTFPDSQAIVGSESTNAAADAALIAAARNALPALLTIAEAAQELLAVDWHADAPVPSVATLTFDFRGDRSALARAVEALLAASTAKATL